MLPTLAVCLLAQPAVSLRPPAFPFSADEARQYQKEYAEADYRAVHVSHADAVAFCRWLSGQPRGAGEPFGTDFGLPTEAQWEWACRAGSGDAYWWGAKE